jgi:hypothetical protein
VSDEAPAVRLPRDYRRDFGFVYINMLKHVKQLDREWDLDSTLGNQTFLCIVDHGMVVIQTSGAGCAGVSAEGSEGAEGAGLQEGMTTIISFSL